MIENSAVGYKVIIIFVLILGLSLFSTAFAQPGAIFSYSDSADVVVLRYWQEIGMLEENDPTPLLIVYGDGKVDVHYPAYMKKAGDYRMRLTPQELSRLLTSMIEKGVMEFDPESVKAMKREAALQRREAAVSRREPLELMHSSDGEKTVIEIYLDEYRAPGKAGVMRNNVQKRVSWHGLRWDAEQYPELTPLKGLAAAEQELRDLVGHGDLQKINSHDR